MITHPFSRLRALRELSQAQLAVRLGVTRHYYLRLEQGLFHEIPDEILKTLVETFGVSSSELSELYRSYQRETREEFKVEHSSFKDILSSYSGLTHPLVWYRGNQGLSRMGLCKGLCLHYDGVTQYEKNVQRSIPQDIKLACEDISWDYTYLESSVIEWRSSGRADQFNRTR